MQEVEVDLGDGDSYVVIFEPSTVGPVAVGLVFKRDDGAALTPAHLRTRRWGEVMAAAEEMAKSPEMPMFVGPGDPPIAFLSHARGRGKGRSKEDFVQLARAVAEWDRQGKGREIARAWTARYPGAQTEKSWRNLISQARKHLVRDDETGTLSVLSADAERILYGDPGMKERLHADHLIESRQEAELERAEADESRAGIQRGGQAWRAIARNGGDPGRTRREARARVAAREAERVAADQGALATYLLLEIAEITEVSGLRTLWAEHRAAFEADSDLLAAWKARGQQIEAREEAVVDG